MLQEQKNNIIDEETQQLVDFYNSIPRIKKEIDNFIDLKLQFLKTQGHNGELDAELKTQLILNFFFEKKLSLYNPIIRVVKFRIELLSLKG